jgi:membrane glycosyltransferase
MNMKAEPSRRTAWLSMAVGATTAIGTGVFAATLFRGGVTVLGIVTTVVFVAIFGWIAFWFWVTAIGAARVFRARRALALEYPLRPGTEPLPATAVLVPIHNEHPESVFARIQAMLESVAATGNGGSFDFYVLSDTTDPDLWLREELEWTQVRGSRAGAPFLYYRRRGNKFRRKSGNVTDFCERWGGLYRYLVVLDADSVMDGKTMVELVRRMESVPQLGILQAPAVPAMRHSLYARAQQFAASVYGPSIFAGLSYLLEGHAGFWGHNAIIRSQAFIDHCGLPGLPGRPPFGGPILSHDFVEAALMQRAGYEVRLAWDLLEGSYEQCPVSLGESARRDRRWCEGNLQHLRLCFSSTFPLKSRVHFAIGIFYYLMSALWAVYLVLFALHYSGATLPLDPQLARASLGLLVTTLVLLLAAKLFGVVLVLVDPRRRALHGGAAGLIASAAVEWVVSVLTAPMFMAAHTVSLFSVISGVSVEWVAPPRDETPSPVRDALRAHGWQSALGALIGAVLWLAAPGLLLWMAPVWFGLLSAVPLAALLSSRGAGLRAAANGLFLVPPETRPPSVIERAQELAQARVAPERSFTHRFKTIIGDPWLNTLHVKLLESSGGKTRPRRVIEPIVNRIVKDGTAAISAKEALAVLSDPWAMRTLHAEHFDRGAHSS